MTLQQQCLLLGSLEEEIRLTKGGPLQRAAASSEEIRGDEPSLSLDIWSTLLCDLRSLILAELYLPATLKRPGQLKSSLPFFAVSLIPSLAFGSGQTPPLPGSPPDCTHSGLEKLKCLSARL